ncbi:MAG TPA: hypothetical protein VGU20_30085 [Stellaceae bacterium]|nr:hypothetical protein [Stellaceae bacterium]
MTGGIPIAIDKGQAKLHFRGVWMPVSDHLLDSAWMKRVIRIKKHHNAARTQTETRIVGGGLSTMFLKMRYNLTTEL